MAVLCFSSLVSKATLNSITSREIYHRFWIVFASPELMAASVLMWLSLEQQLMTSAFNNTENANPPWCIHHSIKLLCLLPQFRRDKRHVSMWPHTWLSPQFSRVLSSVVRWGWNVGKCCKCIADAKNNSSQVEVFAVCFSYWIIGYSANPDYTGRLGDQDYKFNTHLNRHVGGSLNSGIQNYLRKEQ